MNLIIVESPTKAKTISGFLSNDYIIESSNGHVRDLPANFLGVDIKKNFQPSYQILPKAKKRVQELKTQVKKVEKVILATDGDREGEAIAWHLIKALELDEKKNKKIKIERIVFHEITKTAIENALKNPRPLDKNLIDAQQARRILDRLVGYKLSPLLWQKVAKRLSAGRVQSVALRLIVEREIEINKFKPDEYWTINALFKKSSKQFSAQLSKIKNKPIDKFQIKNYSEANKIIKDLDDAEYKVLNIQKKETVKNCPAPFITSSLQQEAFKKLHLNSKTTMMIAQKLYEGVDLAESRTGLITYMRTDSYNVSLEAQSAAREFIAKNFGKNYLPDTPNIFKKKSKLAQEAHEAIRPTDPNRTPDSIKNYLTPQEFKLYNLIWRRFIASQMKPAIFNSVSVEIEANSKNNPDKSSKKNYIFQANGATIKFDGFLKIYPLKFEENELPELKKDEILNLIELKSEQHFTKPPARYNDASLIKIMEKYGIGRPSTYAPIISTIITRGYVKRNEQKFFYPTEIGVMVNTLLTENFPQIVDYNFTAKIENELDNIANGKTKMEKVLKDFYEPFHKLLLEKYKTIKKKDYLKSEITNEICEKCGAPMAIRYSKFGKFLACTNFPVCKNTKSILEKVDFKCPNCGANAVIKITKNGRKFFGCSNYPNCKWMSWKKPNDEKVENRE